MLYVDTPGKFWVLFAATGGMGVGLDTTPAFPMLVNLPTMVSNCSASICSLAIKQLKYGASERCNLRVCP